MTLRLKTRIHFCARIVNFFDTTVKMLSFGIYFSISFYARSLIDVVYALKDEVLELKKVIEA